jgi:hypothetical protein
MFDHHDKHEIAFKRKALTSEAPSISGTSVCFNHVGVTTTESLEESHLHALLEHPRRTCARGGFEPTTSCTARSPLAKSYGNSSCNCYSEPLRSYTLFIRKWLCV